MTNIRKIDEFNSQNFTQYTIHYTSGRKRVFTQKDILPMSVVDFMVADNTVCDIKYINDTYNKCINKRVIWKQEA